MEKSATEAMPAASAALREGRVWQLLQAVPDPEIPVLSVVDLGIVRYVRVPDPGTVEVGISPTYTGCPASETIRDGVRAALVQAGFARVTVHEVLSPPWSSDWLTAEGRRKLAAFGIAPPAASVSSPRLLLGAPAVACPRCGSSSTEQLSAFGSTPCQAHYRCRACLEPFDYFKCL